MLELSNLANLLESVDLVLLVAVDGQASGVVSSVLETRQTYRRANSESVLGCATAAWNWNWSRELELELELALGLALAPVLVLL